MKVIKVKNYEELSRTAATIIAGVILTKPDCILGLATGSSPVGTYDQLAAMYKEGILDFSHVKSVNLDEYVGLDGSNDQSYRYFMNENLFNHVNIDKANTNVPNGKADNMDEEALRYEALIESLGGIDMQLLGIGNNGHIGFNEPSDAFDKITHEVKLTDSTIQANARFFETIDDVPKTAISMGIGTIMKAKKVVLIANGPKKADIIYETCFGPITPNVPASALQMHPDATIIVDEEAYATILAKRGE